MSFSYETKAELCRAGISKTCCAIAEAFGVLLYCNTFSPMEIRIITGNTEFGRRLVPLFAKAFGITFDELPQSFDGGMKGSYVIHGRDKLERVFLMCGYDLMRVSAHHINLGLLEEWCCRASFLRGAFLSGGSVTDPAKRYHLELATAHKSVGRETYSLLLDMEFAPKSLEKGGNIVTYFKQSEAIEDFLTTIGAPLAAMSIMSAKVEKEMRNSINRLVNCDTANAGKTALAAIDQISAIKRITESGLFGELPDKLRKTAELRLENPEASLTELAALSAPPVTKSCLNHRLRKLLEYGKEVN